MHPSCTSFFNIWAHDSWDILDNTHMHARTHTQGQAKAKMKQVDAVALVSAMIARV